jgi:IclR family mhp operon transcriptional activator
VLLPAVRNLSEGLTRSDKASRIVAEELFELLPHVLWPTDFATFERGWMVIRETTHRFSPYSVHRAMVGRRRPLIESALGRAMLVGAESTHRQEMLAIAQSTGATDMPDHRIKEAMRSLIEDYSRRGYTWAVDGAEQGISAIALPVKVSGSALGSVNLLFFTSAMTVETAASRFLPSLRRAVTTISARLQNHSVIEVT